MSTSIYADTMLFNELGAAASDMRAAANATRENQNFVNDTRSKWNMYANYHRNKELAEAKRQYEDAKYAAKQKYAGDKARLEYALGSIENAYKTKTQDINNTYSEWKGNDKKHTESDLARAKFIDANFNGNGEAAAKWKEANDAANAKASTKAKKVNDVKPSASTAGNTNTSVGSSATQYRFNGGISNNAATQIANTLYGNDPSGRSKQLRQQARLHDVQATDEQKSAQQNFQVANRNARAEADKDAVAASAIKNAQTVNNLAAGTSAGTAALNRTVEQGDVAAHRQRADAQRAEGVKNQREMWGARQTAEEERGAANITDYQYRQSVGQTAMSDYLSQPGEDGTAANITDYQYRQSVGQTAMSDYLSQPGEDGTAANTNKPSEAVQENSADTTADTQTGTGTVNGQQCVNAALGYTASKDDVPVSQLEYDTVEKLRATQFPMLSLVPQRTFQARGLDASAAEDAYIRSPQFGGTMADRKAFMDALRALRSPDDIHKNFNEDTARAESATHTIDSVTGDIQPDTDVVKDALTSQIR